MKWIVRIIIWVGAGATVVCMVLIMTPSILTLEQIIVFTGESLVYNFSENFSSELEFRASVEQNRWIFIANELDQIDPTLASVINLRYEFNLGSDYEPNAVDFTQYFTTFNKSRLENAPELTLQAGCPVRRCSLCADLLPDFSDWLDS